VARILVIDDSNFMRRIERQFLESAGHEVEDWMPLSAMEIPERLTKSPVDLILADFNMPGVNGMTVAKMGPSLFRVGNRGYWPAGILGDG